MCKQIVWLNFVSQVHPVKLIGNGTCQSTVLNNKNLIIESKNIVDDNKLGNNVKTLCDFIKCLLLHNKLKNVFSVYEK